MTNNTDRFISLVFWSLAILGALGVVVGGLMSFDPRAGSDGAIGFGAGLLCLALAAVVRVLHAIVTELLRIRVQLEQKLPPRS